MRRLLILIALVACLFFQACDGLFDADCRRASGDVVTQELVLDDLNSISLEVAADVYISKGPEQVVTIEAQQDVIDELNKDINDRYWDISWRDCLRRHKDIKIFITVPEMEEISISGSGDIVVEDTFTQDAVTLQISGSGSIEGRFEANTITCSISGSGDIELQGTAELTSISISGSGGVDAFGLTATEATVSISGSGGANVNVSNMLEVSIAGSGDVRYRGIPSINVRISGSGQLIDAN